MKEKNTLWKTSSASVTVLLVLPILAIFITAAGQSDEVFSHLMSTVMPTYTFNTVVLTFSVMGLSLLFGIPTAWLMAMCKLPTERILQWALVLPLAMPGYIIGYIFTGWFDYAGPVQVLLRDLTGWGAGDYWFPDIRSLGGASIVLALVLYPYVYLLCRAAFMEQNVSLLQSARLLKCSPWQSFRLISLPLARPAMAVGLSLVAMETVGDFGTVSYFAVNTLTTAVYDTWLGYSNLNAAAKISAIMLVIVLLLLSAERYSRRKQKLFQSQFNSHEDFRYQLQGWKKWAALCWCWGLVALAFLLPLLQLVSFAYHYFAKSWTSEFQDFAINSLTVSLTTALVAVLIALVVNFCHRLNANGVTLAFMRLSSMGYAVPGTVLAIGVMVPVLFMDHWVNDVAKAMQWGRPGLIFSGSMFAIIFALVVRFSAVAIGSIESSLNKVSPSLDMAARTMGYRSNAMLWRVHLPLIRRGTLIAGLLVFIESMKELNAALLLRPFNFETLATYVYNYASDEQLEVAALPAILLVAVGLIPLIVVNRSLEQNH
ncbi:iron ABC transporter permease [Vibrio anguillarum]|uniref:ABC transporter permease n=1 Tax=Vibrio TaxID=662 RepID=UPI00097E1B67|nr:MULTISPECIES: iron ABC transporter permease [Vibrio]AQM20269.1 iron ABC transporter permease [Vibrio anguillarum]ATC56679.1 iron ABC transporter permease [Vibrio anguillarum]AUB88671.1 iron ABC transporter permease [Vibrio anguillarum]AUB92112.1 iron ABC transporter permease [Vibrio anguillarum]AUB95549.1 iron ABC transporter permease [Vibrio anguillarum]